ncbi:ATP-binding response regulator [Pseudomonas neuropathica]|uniref:ATP-binding response regulator n=1 Tax=Pseudomonas neuropathica TaxID=2730425 RepID=UPI003EBD0E95
MKFEKNTELDQANLRIIIAAIAVVYMLVLGFLPGQRFDTYLPVVTYIGLFLLASIVLRQAIVRWPGHYPARRIFAMIHDYTGTCFGLVVGGEAALPLYAVIVWVNLGNGMRYGSRYLAIATALALLSLLCVYRLTPVWQAQPFMVLMLMITSTVIPFYAHLLLERTRKASEEAVAANLEKSRFLAQASHDLRQPIHSIGLFTACLRESRLGDEERRLVDNIDRSLLNVSQLFRSILDLYTLDNGRVLPKLQTFNLGEWLAELIGQNAEAARWAGVELRLRPCDYWVRSDPALLATMVQNVLSNCFKYGAHRPVLIGVRRRGAGLAMVICDRGNGIAEEHLAKVFEEFYRVRQVRDKDVEGVGLGLSIVKRLGELIGVGVALRSQLGRGTAVTLCGLPIAAPPSLTVTRDDARQAGLLTGLKVCLVEDDRNVLLATSALLERWGCVVQAEVTAVDLVTDCDIIVADYDLGTHATGIECIDHVRRQRGRAVPAMIITGHDVERIQAALHDRQIAILSKPVRPAELRATLRALRDRQPEPTENAL